MSQAWEWRSPSWYSRTASPGSQHLLAQLVEARGLRIAELGIPGVGRAQLRFQHRQLPLEPTDVGSQGSGAVGGRGAALLQGGHAAEDRLLALAVGRIGADPEVHLGLGHEVEQRAGAAALGGLPGPLAVAGAGILHVEFVEHAHQGVEAAADLAEVAALHVGRAAAAPAHLLDHRDGGLEVPEGLVQAALAAGDLGQAGAGRLLQVEVGQLVRPGGRVAQQRRGLVQAVLVDEGVALDLQGLGGVQGQAVFLGVGQGLVEVGEAAVDLAEHASAVPHGQQDGAFGPPIAGVAYHLQGLLVARQRLGGTALEGLDGGQVGEVPSPAAGVAGEVRRLTILGTGAVEIAGQVADPCLIPEAAGQDVIAARLSSQLFGLLQPHHGAGELATHGVGGADIVERPGSTCQRTRPSVYSS